MKKFLTMLSALMLSAAVSTTAFAAEFNQNSDPKKAQATISTNIQPAYMVTIPEDVEVSFNAVSTDFGSIELTAAQINPNYAVEVSLDASGTLKNQADVSKTIAYTVKDQNGEFTSAQYDAAGESSKLTVTITQDAWNAAYAGSYSDTVTFTVSYTAVQ